MILESLVTTIDQQSNVNLAPMGPVLRNPVAMTQPDVADPKFLLRPFKGSRTCDNLLASRRATVHVSDDAELFALAVVGHKIDVASRVQIKTFTCLGEDRPWAILDQCHRWFAIEVEDILVDGPRFEMPCRVVASGIQRPFFGFNRAKHAVIEAAILATRTHLIDGDVIRSQLEWLTPLVEKTAGDAESRAFDLLRAEIERRLDQAPAKSDPDEATP